MKLLGKRSYVYCFILFLAVSVLVLPAAYAIAASSQYTQACDDCHEMPPVDSTYRNISTGGFVGNHERHAGSDRATCTRCHGASGSYSFAHMTSIIRLSDNINASPATGRYLVNETAVSFVNRTTVPTFGTCSTVNCHFESSTPAWGSPVFSSDNDCSACHSIPGPSTSHARHNQYYSWENNGCVKCHFDYKTGLAFGHATSAANRGIRVALSNGSYSGDGLNWLPSQEASRIFGDCSGVYCHSNGAPFDKATVYATLTWGGSALTCTSCHDGAGDTTGLSGRHGKHTGESSYAFTCERCHQGTATGSDTIADTSLHVNNDKDLSFKEGGSYNSATKLCSSTYCHSDGRGGAPLLEVKWSDTSTMACYSCHKGRAADSTQANCDLVQGWWSSSKGSCTPDLTMASNGHHRLVGPQWVRKYPCYYCHNNTVDAAGAVKDRDMHLNGTKDVVMAPQWNIVGRPVSTYNAVTKICDNVYCHSDGTTDPEDIRPFAWTAPKTECNTCHGHPTGSCNNLLCHDGRTDINGKVWKLSPRFGNVTAYTWPAGEEWMGSMPMFPNQGAGTPRANSHARHLQTDFTCDQCHSTTIRSGACTLCHVDGIPAGGMGEVAHIDAAFHVNKSKDVSFIDGGTYNPISKTCSNTKCHTSGVDPIWGGSTGSAVTCLSCHGTSDGDVDDFNAFNGTQGKINLTAWVNTGHGRYSTSGRYPISNNPAANFPGNPCWYCHDNNVLHKDAANPYRLRMHPQYERRFAKECVYCHMEKSDAECLNCHDTVESLAPQLLNITSSRFTYNHSVYSGGGTSCIASCHATGETIHKLENAKFWTAEEKEDVKNQYMMMGVCLQCHDDDSGGQCTSCHTAPADKPLKYSLGFDPLMEGSRFIKPKKARASSAHFGYKHYRAYERDGIWKGGKFCWDCHDPHGDGNIYMVQNRVATRTDGKFGKPVTTADVVFTKKISGKDYANSDSSKPYNGICQVCHSRESNKHYLSDGGDRHNESRVCTLCHEHRFADSHANKQSCDSCHTDKKPVPKHAAFSLPRDCTKCHAGIIGNRMDVMTQLKSNSHHVQLPNVNDINNRHCYPCHWEATPEGLIDNVYHEGYNFKTYTSVRNAKVDLVIWKPGLRPTYYNTTTAVTFVAKNIGTINERTEAGKVTVHCISCHSDQNNDTIPFDDCKTPRQYAWDFQSIAARYSQTGSATWGKYPATANAAKKNIVKTFSAHGNVAPNQGGWDKTTGVDGTIRDRRKGTANVECFDCHSSHGSSLVGVTSSYLTFNNTRNGGNLKETQAGKGGYSMTYKASSNTAPGAVNPYNAGAGQCFDCHFSKNSGVTPWGYNSTFGVMSSILGYKDTPKFGQGVKASTARFSERDSKKTIVGGHLKASSFLNRTTSAQNRINGLCTPCHDPHGVSPILGDNQAYAVPLLKGTWMTSPYKEDAPPVQPYGDHIRKAPYGSSTPVNGDYIAWGDGIQHQHHPGPAQPETKHTLDRNTFGGSNRISEDDGKFAGLCLSCHKKEYLTDGVNKNQVWKSVDRIHESVKGWGANTEHSFTCSKCHQPHNSGLPRLMLTDCLDYKHRGGRVSGGVPWAADKQTASLAHSRGDEHRGYPIGSILGGRYATAEATTACHLVRFSPGYNSATPPAQWPDENLWNSVTPW